MANAKRHAVTVRLTEDHLRKMIDEHLIKGRTSVIGSRSLAPCKNFWAALWACRTSRGTIGTTGLRDLNNRCSDMRCFGGVLGSRTRGAEMGLSRTEAVDLAAYIATLK